jgi:hypothetical protein
MNWPFAGILGPNCEQVNENSTANAQRLTILAMLCEKGQKLKEDLAKASIRFSDHAPRKGKRKLIAERLEVERLHLAQQDALNAFTHHVEWCSVCTQLGTAHYGSRPATSEEE